MLDEYLERLARVSYEEAAFRGTPRKYEPRGTVIVVDTSVLKHRMYVDSLIDFAQSDGEILIPRRVAREVMGITGEIHCNGNRLLNAIGELVVDPEENAPSEVEALRALWKALPGYFCYGQAIEAVPEWHTQISLSVQRAQHAGYTYTLDRRSDTRRHLEALDNLFYYDRELGLRVAQDIARMVTEYGRVLRSEIMDYGHTPDERFFEGPSKFVQLRFGTILARTFGAVLNGEQAEDVLHRFSSARNNNTDISVVLASYTLPYADKPKVVVMSADRDIEFLLSFRRALGPKNELSPH